VTATVTAAHKPEHRSGRTTAYVWLLLSAITVLSWWLAPGHSGGHAVANVPITVAVVVLGFIKGRMIIRYFMEVRTAPRWLKATTDAWLIVLWAAILAIYLY
jgi:cytochrome c oxidase subunit IV